MALFTWFSFSLFLSGSQRLAKPFINFLLKQDTLPSLPSPLAWSMKCMAAWICMYSGYFLMDSICSLPCVLIFLLISTGELICERELTQESCFILCFDVLYQNAANFKIICFIFAIKRLISKQLSLTLFYCIIFFISFLWVTTAFFRFNHPFIRACYKSSLRG